MADVRPHYVCGQKPQRDGEEDPMVSHFIPQRPAACRCQSEGPPLSSGLAGRCPGPYLVPVYTRDCREMQKRYHEFYKNQNDCLHNPETNCFFLLVSCPPHFGPLDTIQPMCFASTGARGIRPTRVKRNVAYLSAFPYIFLLNSSSSIRN